MFNLISTHSSMSAEIQMLAEKTRDYIGAGRAGKTIRGYRSDWTDFSHWSAAHALRPLPAEPATVAMYLSDSSSRLAVATLSRRLTSITAAHKDAGYLDSPARHPVVLATFKGIRRVIGSAQDAKMPLLTDDLAQIVAACPDTLAGLRDKALLLTSFAAALRRSESAALRCEDVLPTTAGVHNAVGLVLNIRKSKTDQESKGRQVGIARGAHSDTCPVRAIETWQLASGVRTGCLFRAVDFAGRVSPEGLHPDSIAYIIKRCAARAGYSAEDLKKIAGHSLRAGHVSQSTLDEVPDNIVQSRTGHKSARMLDVYRRRVLLFPKHPAAGLGL
jgi:integrase